MGYFKRDPADSSYEPGNELSAAYVAEVIDTPTDEWPGNCFAIASLMLEHGALAPLNTGNSKPRVRYGHWTGPVADDTIFSDRAVVAHGWIEIPSNSLPGGLIVDPTRWYFEAREPYIFVGLNDHYDMGGSQLRNAMQDDHPPGCVDGDGRFRYPDEKYLGQFVKSILMCNCDENRMSIAQLFWIGNTEPRKMEPRTLDIYLWLLDIGQKAVVPIDYWMAYMEDD